MFLSLFDLVFGAFFLVSGVRIVFFKNFSLINNYSPDKGSAYALRAGWLNLAFGALTAVGGILGLLFPNRSIELYLLAILLGRYLVLSALNDKSVGG